MSKYLRPIHPVNARIGERIRLGRKLSKLSQQQLGERLPKPITFQQIQKYEHGTNRISVCMLQDIGEVLELPLVFFLEDMQGIKELLCDEEWRLIMAFRTVAPEMRDAMMVMLNNQKAG